MSRHGLRFSSKWRLIGLFSAAFVCLIAEGFLPRGVPMELSVLEGIATLKVYDVSLPVQVGQGFYHGLSVVGPDSYYAPHVRNAFLDGEPLALSAGDDAQYGILEAPVMDWFIDYSRRTFEVGRGAFPRRDLFSLKFILVMRSEAPVRVELLGDRGFTVFVSSGIISNVLAIQASGGQPQVVPFQPLLTDIITRLLGEILRGACVTLFVLGLVGFLRARVVPRSVAVPKAWAGHSVWLCLGMLVAALVWQSFYFNYEILGALTHIPDEVAYLSQARWLKLGHLGMSVPDFFASAYRAPGQFFKSGEIYSVFPIGWPLVLTIFEVLRIPELASLACALVTIGATWRIGRAFLPFPVLFLTIAFLSVSPLFVIQSSIYMSHAAATMWATVSLLLAHRSMEQRHSHKIAAFYRDWGAAWLCLGLAFSTRPMVAVCFSAGILTDRLFRLERRFSSSTRRHGWSRYCTTLAADMAVAALMVLLGSAPILLQNYALTGTFGVDFYRIYGGNSFALENFRQGLTHLDAILALFKASSLGWLWPLAQGGWANWALAGILGLGLVFGGDRKRFLGICLLIVFMTMGMHTLISVHGIHGYGARFYMELLPLVAIVAAFGFCGLARDCATRLFRFSRWQPSWSLWLVVGMVLTQTYFNSLRLERYRGYNYVNGELQRAIVGSRLREAVVVVSDQSWFPWGDVGKDYLQSSLDDPFIFVSEGIDLSQLRARFPTKPIYHWNGAFVPLVVR